MDGLPKATKLSTFLRQMSVVDSVARLSVDLEPALKALQSADDRLAVDPADQSARETKIGALVSMNRFRSAAKFGASGELTPKAKAFYAYALYRSGHLGELQKLAEPSFAWAQAEYQAGHLQRAAELFGSLPTTTEDDEADLATDLQAIAALRGDVDAVKSYTSSTAFDQHFNAAYALLVSGQPEAALEELALAKTEANDEDDRAATVVQAAVANQLLGNTDEAVALLEQVQAPSANLETVIANNKLALNVPTTPEQVHEALKVYDRLGSSLNADQLAVLHANKLVLRFKADLLTASQIRAHEKAYGDFDLSSAVLLKSKESAKSLRRDRSVAGILAYAQTLANNDDFVGAARAVLNLDMQKPLPAGLVGAIKAANEILGRESNVKIALSSERGFHDLIPAVLAEDGSVFDKLGSDVLRAAGACVSTPSQVTDEQLSLLPSIDELVEGIDVDAVKPIPPKRTVQFKVAKRRKRSGKPKLPADYDPERVPDPERWLAKQDRSTYKPKKGKKTQASQGAVVAETTPEPVVKSKTKAKKKKGKK